MIHPTAIIDPSAELHADVQVGAYSIIGARSEIGSGTRIRPHAVVGSDTRVGSDCDIFQFASVGGDPQDLGYRGEQTRLEIGDRCVIREGVTISRGTPKGGGITRVGADGFLMAQVHIAHDCQVGKGAIFANGASLAGHCEVADHVILSGYSLIHQFSVIGLRAFTSMGAALNRDLPPFCLASGNYARAIGINKVGLRRAGISAEAIQALQQAFRIMVRQRQGAAGAAQLAPLMAQYPEVQEFVSFIQVSKRGILRSGRQVTAAE